MENLDYIINRFKIDLAKESPYLINFNRLTDLPILFKELGFTNGAEIGVLEGNFSEILCKSNPDMTVYSVDAWEIYPLYNNFRRQWQYKRFYQTTVAKLSKYPNSKIIRKWSMDAVKNFADESLDFVFIDSDHRFQAVTNDIAEWSKKVKIGGIISGHDFGEGCRSTDFVHVTKVVPAWAAAYKIHPWFVLNARHEESWMWVKTRNLP
jgi:hypothetical protein